MGGFLSTPQDGCIFGKPFHGNHIATPYPLRVSQPYVLLVNNHGNLIESQDGILDRVAKIHLILDNPFDLVDIPFSGLSSQRNPLRANRNRDRVALMDIPLVEIGIRPIIQRLSWVHPIRTLKVCQLFLYRVERADSGQFILKKVLNPSLRSRACQSAGSFQGWKPPSVRELPRE